jgi:hypothetical protein
MLPHSYVASTGLVLGLSGLCGMPTDVTQAGETFQLASQLEGSIIWLEVYLWSSS